MTWFKVDDGFYSSRKVLSIPRAQRLAAVGLWTLAGNWSGKELTDGRVPNFVLDDLGATRKLIDVLVEAGLWSEFDASGEAVVRQPSASGAPVVRRSRARRAEGYIVFANWSKYQPTREQVEAERSKTAERQRRWRDRKAEETGDQHVSDGVSNGVTNGVSNPVSHDAPTRPDPTYISTSNEVDTPLPPIQAPKTPRATRIPERFVVTAEMRQWAAAEVPGLDVDAVTRTFVDHWRAESGAKASKRDWVAAWRNWLRRSLSYQQPQRGGTRPLTRTEQNMSVVEQIAAKEAAQQKGISA